ncbi:hypothetical protein DXG01_015819 [Tephrocybe rancida]|nr:hypothetical protein DXG01_015819 [Tephrocybe rancida]
MVSLLRTVRNMRRVGLREWWRQMQYIGDAKSGTYMGKDQFGNRYFENTNQYEELPVPPEWHSWLQHIRLNPPQEDPVMLNSSPAWKAPWVENLTGTRGAYRPYNTTPPKISAWEPKVARRN